MRLGHYFEWLHTRHLETTGRAQILTKNLQLRGPAQGPAGKWMSFSGPGKKRHSSRDRREILHRGGRSRRPQQLDRAPHHRPPRHKARPHAGAPASPTGKGGGPRGMASQAPTTRQKEALLGGMFFRHINHHHWPAGMAPEAAKGFWCHVKDFSEWGVADGAGSRPGNGSSWKSHGGSAPYNINLKRRYLCQRFATRLQTPDALPWWRASPMTESAINETTTNQTGIRATPGPSAGHRRPAWLCGSRRVAGRPLGLGRRSRKLWPDEPRLGMRSEAAGVARTTRNGQPAVSVRNEWAEALVYCQGTPGVIPSQRF